MEYNNHNSKNRTGLLIYNEDLEKNIKNNKGNNKLLLIYVYINDNKNNILIFIEEEKSFIIQSDKKNNFSQIFIGLFIITDIIIILF